MKCFKLYTGIDCGDEKCPLNCNEEKRQGQCINGTCLCNAHWTGKGCQHKDAQTIAGTMATAKKESVSATKGTVNCAQSVMLSMVNATLNLVNVNAIL